MSNISSLSEIIKGILPDAFIHITFWDVAIWQWLSLPLFLALAYFLSMAVTYWTLKISLVAIQRNFPNFSKRNLKIARAPLRLGFLLAFFAAGIELIALPQNAHEIVVVFEKLLGVFTATWLSFRIIDVFVKWLQTRLQQKGKASVITTLPLVQRGSKIALTLIAALLALQNIGVDVTAILAGLGVGGIAVALAAKKSLENLFGGVMLVIDQPIRVGDFGQFGSFMGTVEDIGLQSTRVRTLNRTLVTIPNADLSQTRIESYTARDQIRLQCVIGLRYETTPDQIRYVIVKIRELLNRHPKIANDRIRVRFAEFNSYSLDINIVAFALTNIFMEFTGIKEDIYLSIMDIVAEAGSGFAFPSRTIYTAQDTPLDSQKATQAQAEVNDWKNKHELAIPEFSPEQLDKLHQNPVQFPPKGSVLS